MEEEPEQKLVSAPSNELEYQLNPETCKPTKLNKNGKPRKQLSPEALERLAKAREKANAMRQQAYAKKLEEKVEKIRGERPEPANKEEEQKPLTETTNEVTEPEPAEVKEVVEKKVKPKGKKKTKIIVEQSSDDSDEFEPNDNVVFVKRVSRRGKRPEPAVEPVPEPVKESEPPPQMPPRPPPRPELTPQQRILKSQYEGMFSGGFMNNNLMRRHY